MNNFLIYCKKVIFKWIVLLGFLPLLYDYFQAFFPEPIKSFKIPLHILYFFLPIGLFISAFQIWREQKEEIDSIKSKYTNFTVTPIVTKVSVNKHLQEVEKEITEVRNKMNSLPNSSSTFQGWFNPDILFGNSTPDKDTYAEWIGMLNSYKKDIETFRDTYKKLLTFNLKIDANRFDDNIDVNIVIKSDAKFADKIILKYPNYPITKRSSILDLPNNPLVNINRGEPYRIRISQRDKFTECNLRYIKKDDSAYFSNDPILLLCNADEVNLSVTINSKGSDGEKNFDFSFKYSEINKSSETLDIKAFGISIS